MTNKTTKAEQKRHAEFAKLFAETCVRNNTSLEDLHAGVSPVSKTGDYSDVKVIDGEGNEIAWNDLSRLNEDEMKILMKQIVNNMYTYLMLANEPGFFAMIQEMSSTRRRDDPEINESWRSMLEKIRRLNPAPAP